MKVEPLIGEYCVDCAKTLATGVMKEGSIFPLCHSCLDTFTRTDDFATAQSIVLNSYEKKLAVCVRALKEIHRGCKKRDQFHCGCSCDEAREALSEIGEK